MFTEYYADVKKTQGFSARSALRHLSLNLLSTLNSSSWKSLFQTPAVQFIYIHHIFRDEEPMLRKLLERLSATHTFISHSEASRKVLKGPIDKPYISVSSDDGFKNNVRAAAILKEYGVSACFFICPGMIGNQSLSGIAEFCKERLHLPPVEFMDWNDVDMLMKSGHEIGSHTLSHVRISGRPEEVLRNEIGGSYEQIRRHCGSADHFAFPYGRFSDFNEMARKIVFDAGHRTCSSAERGCVVKPVVQMNPEEVLFRRDHVILDWPIDHILYFLARNLEKPALQSVQYP
jgi:peptidoglycan/xylan/chitin deacetylase (PgdA/CDA1 family)